VTEAWLRVEGFFAGLIAGDVPGQIGAVALCLLAGWIAAAAARARLRSRGGRAPAMTGTHFAAEVAVVLTPVLVSLLLVLLVRVAMQSAGFDIGILDVAIRLIAVYTLDSVGVAAGRSRITLWSVLKLLFTLSVFILVAAWISRWIDQRLKKLRNLAPSTRIGLAKFANAFLIGLSVLLGLNAAGVDLTALTVLTGAIGLGLGFGLQSIAANFVSGFVLLMDRSIKPGDVISFSGQSGTNTENFGWVHELRGRYVVVRDRDGVETLVPNQQLISNPVVNWSYTDPRIRLKLPIRISYQDDPELALTVLIAACEGQRRVLHEPAPASRLMHFSDSGIELELRFWISDPQEGVNNVRSEVNRAIWRLFKQHGLTMPVAQREILVHRARPERD
jgi:small-conductance mechanosensitive channel